MSSNPKQEINTWCKPVKGATPFWRLFISEETEQRIRAFFRRQHSR